MVYGICLKSLPVPNQTADAEVIVVGSGVAGLVAALTCACAGLRVLVLEKSALIGGTTAHSEAMVWVPLSRQARAAGVHDSREAALAYLAAAAGPQHRADLASAYVDHAAQALAFVEDHSPVRWSLTPASIDYHPSLPGATQGGRALSPGAFDGRKLGARFAHLRAPLDTTMILGGLSISGADLPHYYRLGRSVRSTVYVGSRVARYAIDRLRGFARGTALGGGNGVVAGLVLALGQLGVEVRRHSRVIDLVRHAGRVIGVRA